MEDFILREINKIGQLIEAVLQKLGIMKGASQQEQLYAAAREELLEKLKMDVDSLPEGDDVVAELRQKYGFTNADLEKFAELLFTLVPPAPDADTRMKLVGRIIGIYRYLEVHEPSFSWSRYYILKELKNYTD